MEKPRVYASKKILRTGNRRRRAENVWRGCISRPPGAHRKSKIQRSSSSTSATSGSQKEQFTELMQTQINLDREAKKEHMERELAARLAVCEIQKRNEELKILTFDTTGDEPGGRSEDRGFERRGPG
nr:hypothetical protein [Tanacetum cinerariifolium]